MKKGILYIIGACFMPLLSFGQHWEFGVMLGGSNYSGDLAPAPIVLAETHPAVGGLIRYNVQPHFTLKGNIYYGTISGTDEHAETEKNRLRNLSFKSNILDIGINGEYNLMPFETGSADVFAPYLFAGLSVFKFDPEAYLPDTKEWVRLQPLGTEGQGTTKYNDRRKYSLSQVSIPFGFGLKYNFAGNWNLGMEFGWRKTFTDYLDDVSSTYVEYDYLRSESGDLAARLSNRTGELGTLQNYGPKDMRGNPTNKDWYMFGGLTLTYTILPHTCYQF